MTLTKIKPAGLDKPIDLANNEKIRLGGATGIEVYHSGSKGFIDNNTGDIEIVSAARIELQGNNGTQTLARFTNDGKSELFYNGTSKIETTDTGVKVTDAILEIADTSCLIDLMETGATDGNHRIRNGSGNFLIQNITDDKSTTRDQLLIDGGTGTVELYHNGTKMFQTSADGVEVIDDNASVHVKMISSGGTAGYLYGSSDNQLGLLDRDGDWLLVGNHGGSTNLYYDYANHSTPKLKTTATGVEVSGNVKVSSSGGINFHNYGTGTNVSSNLLDDYEEGTWTPGLTWTAGSYGTFSYQVQLGNYIKIGNHVTAWWHIRTGTIGSPSGISASNNFVRLTGFPFTNTNVNTASEGATFNINYYSQMNGLDNKSPSGYIRQNNTDGYITLIGEGSGTSNWLASALDQTTSWQTYGVCSYFSA